MTDHSRPEQVYELDLKRVLDLILSQWLYILLFVVVVVFLFGAALVLLGGEEEYYSEVMLYLPDSITESLDVAVLPARLTRESILFRVYEQDTEYEKMGFLDYRNQFSASVLHDDALSLKVTTEQLGDAKRLVNIWKEVVEEEVIRPLQSSKEADQEEKVQDKYDDYQQSYLAYKDYVVAEGIEEKKQKVSELHIQVNNSMRSKVDLQALKDNIQTLKEELGDEKADYILSGSNLLLLEKIFTWFIVENRNVDFGEMLFAEDALPTPVIKEEVSPLLNDLESYVDAAIDFQVEDIRSASAEIALLNIEINEDPRLNELEDEVNFQKQQYLSALNTLEEITEEGYVVTDSWEQPQLSRWEQISGLKLAVITAAALLLAVFSVILRDWWVKL